ncbi:MAG: glutamate racemase [Burkholderiaceae bacterium]|jgi:glutamate racemase|nr:glutamate racemase [Burkholderiaceae bacterium]
MHPTHAASSQPAANAPSLAQAPIGVFDSGIGGLSVLQALRTALPHEDFVYVADSAHAPYGERDDACIARRAQAIALHLRQNHRAKALVVACNTASAAAAHTLRKAHPGWPIVAIEPALKPAALRTRTGRVGVLATRGTLGSPKYAALRAAVLQAHPAVHFSEQACDGLAAAIEHWASSGDGDLARALLAQYLRQLGALGDAPEAIDTLALGCTHYPLIGPQIQRRVPVGVALIDAGVPVARQTQRVLHATGLLRDAADAADAEKRAGQLTLLATGTDARALQAAANRWLERATAGSGGDCGVQTCPELA